MNIITPKTEYVLIKISKPKMTWVNTIDYGDKL